MKLSRNMLAVVFAGVAAAGFATALPALVDSLDLHRSENFRVRVLNDAETTEMANLRLFSAKVISREEYEARQNRFGACLNADVSMIEAIKSGDTGRTHIEQDVFAKVCYEAARMR